MSADWIIYHINELVTLRGKTTLCCGKEMKDIEILNDAYVIIKGEWVIDVGTGTGYEPYLGPHTEVIDGSSLLVTPGLIDSHTHLVHGGSRENELALKLEGASYMDILQAGGGILSTVEQTRSASKEELFHKAMKTLDTMLIHGVTTLESKSGYGLDLQTEVKQLEVSQTLNEAHPIDLVHTFMGAHAIPTGMGSSTYIDEVIKMLPIIKEHNLAQFCDVFCETGVFSIVESERLLNVAKQLGFELKIHADEMAPIGGAQLAAKLSCRSADHLMATQQADFIKLRDAHVVCNLLPGTSFNLNKPYAKAREMIDIGCGVSLSTDYNPGSCPLVNIQLVMQLGTLKLGMDPREVITAVTKNAAYSIGMEKTKGSIEIGKKADLALFDVKNLNQLITFFGVNHIKHVFKNGKCVVFNQQLVR